MEFVSIIMMAIIAEGIVTYVRELFVDGKLIWQMLLSLFIGVLCTTAYDIDLFTAVGMNSTLPYIGCILTGILISRGSNYIFDLIKKLDDIINNN